MIRLSRRPLQHPIEDMVKAHNRMAPGGLLWSESPIPRRFVPRVPAAGEEPEVEVPPEPLPQLWWKFDEASGLFHDSVSDAATLTGGVSAAYHRPPIAPDSTWSVSTGASIETDDQVIPAVTPGPTGWIVFDWWVKDLDMTLDGRPVTAKVLDFVSADSYDGTNYWRLQAYFIAEHPDIYTKKLRFVMGPATILTITGWDNPAHFRWKIKPGVGWQLWMGSTQIGSGASGVTWGGLWAVEFAAVDVGMYLDEFKVYGE